MADEPPSGEQKQRDEATIMVPSRVQNPEESKEPQLPPGPNPELQDDKKAAAMSAEDRELNDRLNLAVERLEDIEPELVRAALELLRKELRESTSSMTSVPKPLKFLGPKFAAIKKVYNAMAHLENKLLLADILSCLAMTVGKEPNESLKFKLKGHTDDLASWGTEYVRSLAGEIGAEWQLRNDQAAAGAQANVEDLRALVAQIVPFNMAHNAEVEAVDLLLETGCLELLLAPGAVDVSSHARVCLYLLKCADYLGVADESASCIDTAFRLYLGHGQYPDALRVALRRGGSKDVVNEKLRVVFDAATDPGVKRQLAYICGRHRVNFSTHDEVLDGLIGNNTISELFVALARDLDTVEAKTPEDIYKSHLSGDKRETAAERVDSAKANLAATYVNAFVNAGYGQDKLMTTEDSKWVFKNKDHGQMAAAASLGMVHLWNESQLSELDKFLHAEEDYVRAGSLLGMALACTGTRNLDIDPAFALLSEHVDTSTNATSTHAMRMSAIFGLGMVYAGSGRGDVVELLMPYVSDTSASSSMELSAIAGLAMGMVQVGSSDEVCAAVIADRLMESNEVEAGMAIARHLALGLGLLFLGRGEAADAMLEVVSAIESPLGVLARILLKSCAYAGTGDVLCAQELLRLCAAHPEAEDKEKREKEAKEKDAVEKEAKAKAAGPGGPTSAAAMAAAAAAAAEKEAASPASSADVAGKYVHQSAAVLGLALVSMGEEMSVDMTTRMADHLLQYGDTSVRRAVPLALGLCHVSDPDYGIVDILSKLSHDSNEETSQSAIFAMGLVGAGTNNSRVAGLLRTLATFYRSEPTLLFVVRLAQGLLHMGKGLISLNPFHSDRLLLSPVALSGIISSMLLFLDVKATVHGKFHFLLYSFAIAMNPRWCVTLDETGAEVKVEVRVGGAVQTVGQAGKPKTITGFQTHTTPVLMQVKDRAELVDDAFIPLTTVVEGIVVLRANPLARAKAGAGGGKADKSSS